MILLKDVVEGRVPVDTGTSDQVRRSISIARWQGVRRMAIRVDHSRAELAGLSIASRFGDSRKIDRVTEKKQSAQ